MKKYLFLILTLSLFLSAAAQNGKKRKKPKGGIANTFVDSQWWLGFKLGGNITGAVSEATYSTISPINYNPADNNKVYMNNSEPGGSAGVDFSFYFKGFSVSVQPNYRRQRFSYQNHYEWTDPENLDNFLELDYRQRTNLDYLEIPLLFKYNYGENSVRPFIQIGGYYGHLIDANKELKVSGTDRASGQAQAFENEDLTVGADALFIKSSLGLMGGIGVNYHIENIRITFDISYRYGMHNITNAKNRFSDNRLAGIGDAADDISLRNTSVTLGVMFPMKFLSKGFDAIN